MIEEEFGNEKKLPYFKYRLAIVGEPFVGKSSLFKVVHGKEFPTKISSSLGIDGATIFRDVIYEEKENDFFVFEIAGNHKYLEKNEQYVKDIDAALILYNVTDRNSFDNVDFWIKFLRENIKGQDNCIIFLMGTKVDLLNEGKKREVEIKEAESKCKSSNLIWTEEISIKNSTKEELKEKFKGLFKTIREKRINKKEEEKGTSNFNIEESSNEKSSEKKKKKCSNCCK